MNIVRVLASTLALVSAFAAVPAVAQADEGRHQAPASVDRDRRGDHDRGRADHRRDFDRDWRGYRVGATPAAVCRFEWENGAPVERMIQIGCFVR